MNTNDIKAESYQMTQNSEEITNLIFQFLRETNMLHTAFCYKHEAKITNEEKMQPLRLMNLIEKGFIMEKLEQESRNDFIKSNKDRADNFNQIKSKLKSQSEIFTGTLSNKINLKKYIDNILQEELNKVLHERLNGSFENLAMNDDDTIERNKIKKLRNETIRFKSFSSKNTRRNSSIAFKNENVVNENSINNKTQQVTNPFIRSNSIQTDVVDPHTQLGKLDLTEIKSEQSSKNFNLHKNQDPNQDQKKELFLNELSMNKAFTPNHSFEIPKGADATFNSLNKILIDSNSAGKNSLQKKSQKNNDSKRDSILFEETEDSGFNFYSYLEYQNYILGFDESFKKIALIEISKDQLQSDQDGTPAFKQKIFQISYLLKKKELRYIMGDMLVFYSPQEFIVFDYK